MEKSGHRKHAENSGAALAFDTRMRYNDKAMKELSLALLRDPSLKDLPQRIEAGLLPALVSGLWERFTFSGHIHIAAVTARHQH